jgi:hypothetical protein
MSYSIYISMHKLVYGRRRPAVSHLLVGAIAVSLCATHGHARECYSAIDRGTCATKQTLKAAVFDGMHLRTGRVQTLLLQVRQRKVIERAKLPFCVLHRVSNALKQTYMDFIYIYIYIIQSCLSLLVRAFKFATCFGSTGGHHQVYRLHMSRL